MNRPKKKRRETKKVQDKESRTLFPTFKVLWPLQRQPACYNRGSHFPLIKKNLKLQKWGIQIAGGGRGLVPKKIMAAFLSSKVWQGRFFNKCCRNLFALDNIFVGINPLIHYYKLVLNNYKDERDMERVRPVLCTTAQWTGHCVLPAHSPGKVRFWSDRRKTWCGTFRPHWVGF